MDFREVTAFGKRYKVEEDATALEIQAHILLDNPEVAAQGDPERVRQIVERGQRDYDVRTHQLPWLLRSGRDIAMGAAGAIGAVPLALFSTAEQLTAPEAEIKATDRSKAYHSLTRSDNSSLVDMIKPGSARKADLAEIGVYESEDGLLHFNPKRVISSSTMGPPMEIELTKPEFFGDKDAITREEAIANAKFLKEQAELEVARTETTFLGAMLTHFREDTEQTLRSWQQPSVYFDQTSEQRPQGVEGFKKDPIQEAVNVLSAVPEALGQFGALTAVSTVAPYAVPLVAYSQEYSYSYINAPEDLTKAEKVERSLAQAMIAGTLEYAGFSMTARKALSGIAGKHTLEGLRSARAARKALRAEGYVAVKEGSQTLYKKTAQDLATEMVVKVSHRPQVSRAVMRRIEKMPIPFSLAEAVPEALQEASQAFIVDHRVPTFDEFLLAGVVGGIAGGVPGSTVKIARKIKKSYRDGRYGDSTPIEAAEQVVAELFDSPEGLLATADPELTTTLAQYLAEKDLDTADALALKLRDQAKEKGIKIKDQVAFKYMRDPEAPYVAEEYDLISTDPTERETEMESLFPGLTKVKESTKEGDIKPLYRKVIEGEVSLETFYEHLKHAYNTGNIQTNGFSAVEFRWLRDNLIPQLAMQTNPGGFTDPNKALPPDMTNAFIDSILAAEGGKVQDEPMVAPEVVSLHLRVLQNFLYKTAVNTRNPATGKNFTSVSELVNSPRGPLIISSYMNDTMTEHGSFKNIPSVALELYADSPSIIYHELGHFISELTRRDSELDKRLKDAYQKLYPKAVEAGIREVTHTDKGLATTKLPKRAAKKVTEPYEFLATLIESYVVSEDFRFELQRRNPDESGLIDQLIESMTHIAELSTRSESYLDLTTDISSEPGKATTLKDLAQDIFFMEDVVKDSLQFGAAEDSPVAYVIDTKGAPVELTGQALPILPDRILSSGRLQPVEPDVLKKRYQPKDFDAYSITKKAREIPDEPAVVIRNGWAQLSYDLAEGKLPDFFKDEKARKSALKAKGIKLSSYKQVQDAELKLKELGRKLKAEIDAIKGDPSGADVIIEVDLSKTSLTEREMKAQALVGNLLEGTQVSTNEGEPIRVNYTTKKYQSLSSKLRSFQPGRSIKEGSMYLNLRNLLDLSTPITTPSIKRAKTVTREEIDPTTGEARQVTEEVEEFESIERLTEISAEAYSSGMAGQDLIAVPDPVYVGIREQLPNAQLPTDGTLYDLIRTAEAAGLDVKSFLKKQGYDGTKHIDRNLKTIYTPLDNRNVVKVRTVELDLFAAKAPAGTKPFDKKTRAKFFPGTALDMSIYNSETEKKRAGNHVEFGKARGLVYRYATDVEASLEQASDILGDAKEIAKILRGRSQRLSIPQGIALGELVYSGYERFEQILKEAKFESDVTEALYQHAQAQLSRYRSNLGAQLQSIQAVTIPQQVVGTLHLLAKKMNTLDPNLQKQILALKPSDLMNLSKLGFKKLSPTIKQLEALIKSGESITSIQESAIQGLVNSLMDVQKLSKAQITPAHLRRMSRNISQLTGLLNRDTVLRGRILAFYYTNALGTALGRGQDLLSNVGMMATQFSFGPFEYMVEAGIHGLEGLAGKKTPWTRTYKELFPSVFVRTVTKGGAAGFDAGRKVLLGITSLTEATADLDLMGGSQLSVLEWDANHGEGWSKFWASKAIYVTRAMVAVDAIVREMGYEYGNRLVQAKLENLSESDFRAWAEKVIPPSVLLEYGKAASVTELLDKAIDFKGKKINNGYEKIFVQGFGHQIANEVTAQGVVDPAMSSVYKGMDWADNQIRELLMKNIPPALGVFGKGPRTVGEYISSVPYLRLSSAPFRSTLWNLIKLSSEITPLGYTLPGASPFALMTAYTTITKKRTIPEFLARQIVAHILGELTRQLFKRGLVYGPPENEEEKQARIMRGQPDFGFTLKFGDEIQYMGFPEPLDFALTPVIALLQRRERIIEAGGDVAKLRAANNDYMRSWGSFLQYNTFVGRAERSFMEGFKPVQLLQNFVPFSRFLREMADFHRSFQERGEPLVEYGGSWNPVTQTQIEVAAAIEKFPFGRNINAFLGRTIPGFEAEVPRVVNMFGEVVERERLKGMPQLFGWMPGPQTRPLDALEQEFDELEWYPALPPRRRTIQGGEVLLPDSVYQDYCLTYGALVKRNLEPMVRTNFYLGMSKEGKLNYLDRMLTKQRDLAWSIIQRKNRELVREGIEKGREEKRAIRRRNF